MTRLPRWADLVLVPLISLALAAFAAFGASRRYGSSSLSQ